MGATVAYQDKEDDAKEELCDAREIEDLWVAEERHFRLGSSCVLVQATAPDNLRGVD